MTEPRNADRRMTYVLEPDDDEDGRFIARASYPSSRRITFVPVPSTPPPELESEDSYIDGWFV